MRSLVPHLLLLAGPLSAQLALETGTTDLGQIPVGSGRLVSVLLRNTGSSPVLVDEVTSLDPALSLPASPVTGSARWLAGLGSFSFFVRVAPLKPGPLAAGLRVRGPNDTVTIILVAHAVAVFISEVLADPPAGASGDANGDGTRGTYADEFVELRNAGPQTVDIGGWRLGDDDTPVADWFEFPPTPLAPGERAVLFGGGAPTGIPGPSFVDDGRIGNGLANGGDRILLLTASLDTADVVDGSGWGNDRSLARDTPDSPLLPHDAVDGVSEPFSPGRAAEAGPAAFVDAPGRAAATILIVEILADPPPGDEGDANGDGVRETYADEFVELLNVVDVDVDIGGWSLSDDDTDADRRFHFPPGTVLPPGGRVVVFGGGTVAAGGHAFADDGRIGNGLTNGGDGVILRDAAGDTVDAVSGRDWPADRASVRVPEDCTATCDWRPHDDLDAGAGRFSPGTSERTRTSSSRSTTPGPTRSTCRAGNRPPAALASSRPCASGKITWRRRPP